MRKRILLIGFGFIGSSLYKVLRNSSKHNNFEIVVIDRNQPAYDFNSELDKWIVSDYKEYELLDDLLECVDFVFYFVSTTVPCSSIVLPSQEVSENIIPFLRILESLKRSCKNPLVVFPSSASVYGNQVSIPIKEDAPIRPISFHGLYKSTIEQYLILYSQKFHLRSVILRISNPYGVTQNINKGQGIIPLIINSIREKKSIKLFGVSTCTRDFIHVDDVANAFEKLLINSPNHAIYNISYGSETTISHLVDLIQMIYKAELKVEKLPERSTDILRSSLDSSLFANEFNWQPSISLENGLRNLKLFE
tara:strand:+ start:180 stop:1100 length:921 start_codon:yes stop_codon:yes gene_type:complete